MGRKGFSDRNYPHGFGYALEVGSQPVKEVVLQRVPVPHLIGAGEARDHV